MSRRKEKFIAAKSANTSRNQTAATRDVGSAVEAIADYRTVVQSVDGWDSITATFRLISHGASVPARCLAAVAPGWGPLGPPILHVGHFTPCVHGAGDFSRFVGALEDRLEGRLSRNSRNRSDVIDALEAALRDMSADLLRVVDSHPSVTVCAGGCCFHGLGCWHDPITQRSAS